MLFLDCKVIDNESVALAYSNIQALRSACSSEVFKNGIFGSILMRYLQDQVGLFLAEYFLWSQIHFKKIQSLFSQTLTSICSQEDLKIGYWGLYCIDSLKACFLVSNFQREIIFQLLVLRFFYGTWLRITKLVNNKKLIAGQSTSHE